MVILFSEDIKVKLWRICKLEEYAIQVKDVSKKFRLYHEKRTTFFEEFASKFNKKPHYETLQVLDHISFNVKKGESFGIIGRNGSGKTTLLRLISRIYNPDSGSIQINGKIIPVLGLGLGFHPELTAISNIYQSSILLGMTKQQISEHVEKIIEYAELEKFADTKLKNFSSGMQMRLSFSTAVQVDPDILLLDEVYAVGDANFQKKCHETIFEFKKKGKAIILVSHDMNDMQNFCDRAMFLNKGKIASIGDSKDTVKAYADYLNKEF